MKRIFVVIFLLLLSFLSFASDNNQMTQPDISFEQIIKKANAGDAYAQFTLGSRYENGQGVTQDYKEAVKWYRLAAEQGDTEAQYRLGMMYFRGEAVLKNFNDFYKWVRMSAEQGCARAQSRLGAMYYYGNDGSHGYYKEALKWYRMAAEQRDTEAQYNLGVMYYDGKGVIEDYVEAYKWILLAGMNGKNVDRLKSLLENQMTTAQITEAQRLVEIKVTRKK